MTLFLLNPDPTPLLPLLPPQHPLLGTAATLEPGLEAIAQCRPDVVGYHFATPGGPGWDDVMQHLEAAGAEVLVLSELPTLAYEAFRLGAAAFALWPPDAEEIAAALRRLERRIIEKQALQRCPPTNRP